MLGEEVVDRFRRGAVATRRLERERLEDRACCRAEIVVLGMLLALRPCGAHQGVTFELLAKKNTGVLLLLMRDSAVREQG
jgi:hypothetical protein